jgi:hypothetical protein
MAKTCAIFACLLLACSECHTPFNHEASQSNHCACLSAAGDKAEFMYAAFADVKMLSVHLLRTGTQQCQNDITVAPVNNEPANY